MKKIVSDYYDLTYFLMASNSSKTQNQRGTSNDHKAWHLLLDAHSFSDKTSILKPTVSLTSTFLLSLPLGAPVEISRSCSVTQLVTCKATCQQQPLKPSLGLLGTRGTQSSKRQSVAHRTAGQLEIIPCSS